MTFREPGLRSVLLVGTAGGLEDKARPVQGRRAPRGTQGTRGPAPSGTAPAARGSGPCRPGGVEPVGAENSSGHAEQASRPTRSDPCWADRILAWPAPSTVLSASCWISSCFAFDGTGQKTP